MKNTITILMILIFFIGSYYLLFNKKEDSIKVGQTWKYVFDEDNPYSEPYIQYRKVIDISGEYVLYVKNGKDTLNERKYWFVVGSKCIYNCK